MSVLRLSQFLQKLLDDESEIKKIMIRKLIAGIRGAVASRDLDVILEHDHLKIVGKVVKTGKSVSKSGNGQGMYTDFLIYDPENFNTWFAKTRAEYIITAFAGAAEKRNLDGLTIEQAKIEFERYQKRMLEKLKPKSKK